jgi:acyl-CoA synthetase (AMP-forming)/AMP-acid ligase II
MRCGLRDLVAAISGSARLPTAQLIRNCIRDDAGTRLTYGEFVASANRLATSIAHLTGRLAVIPAANDTSTVLALLAALSAGITVALIDPDLSESARTDLIAKFRPELLYSPATGFAETAYMGERIAQAVGILMSTSGSSGAVKFVRIPLSALLANAGQISAALNITDHDVAVCHLPLHYSYGLSVLLSHLHRGAAALLTNCKVTSPELRSAVASGGGTHFPGVPFHYTVLNRLGIAKLLPDCVTTFTQAGGHLDFDLRKMIYEQVRARGGRFYVMYGQTEAAPRMTILEPDRFGKKAQSVGRALDGGRIEIVNERGEPLAAGEIGEVIYYGPNVMWGYANHRNDLMHGDELKGRLTTGDRGWLDDEGDLFLVGRNQRFAKIVGKRIGLDEVEKRLGSQFEIVLMPAEDAIQVFCDKMDDVTALRKSLDSVARDYAIPRRAFVLREITEVPRLKSGKIDFGFLRGLM